MTDSSVRHSGQSPTVILPLSHTPLSRTSILLVTFCGIYVQADLCNCSSSVHVSLRAVGGWGGCFCRGVWSLALIRPMWDLSPQCPHGAWLHMAVSDHFLLSLRLSPFTCPPSVALLCVLSSLAHVFLSVSEILEISPHVSVPRTCGVSCVWCPSGFVWVHGVPSCVICACGRAVGRGKGEGHVSLCQSLSCMVADWLPVGVSMVLVPLSMRWMVGLFEIGSIALWVRFMLRRGL